MTTEQLICLVIFIITYVSIIAFHRYKFIIAWGGVGFMLLFGILAPLKPLQYINWNILGIFWGSLVVAELFIYSRIPAPVEIGFLGEFKTGRNLTIPSKRSKFIEKITSKII